MAGFFGGWFGGWGKGAPFEVEFDVESFEYEAYAWGIAVDVGCSDHNVAFGKDDDVGSAEEFEGLTLFFVGVGSEDALDGPYLEAAWGFEVDVDVAEAYDIVGDARVGEYGFDVALDDDVVFFDPFGGGAEGFVDGVSLFDGLLVFECGDFGPDPDGVGLDGVEVGVTALAYVNSGVIVGGAELE